MLPEFFARLGAVAALTAALVSAQAAVAEPKHGIAMYGDPALPPDFVSLPHVNPDAPKGGTIVFGQPGGFDSLNPFILKGTAPDTIVPYVFETLMGRNWDEPFSLYGLLAESVETGPNRDWVEFVLRPEARFSDGSPVTVEDVVWSFDILNTLGHPRYLGAGQKIARTEITGPRSIRVTFNTPDRELALLMGLRPILQKAQWQGRDFAASGLDVVPVGSGPYVIASFDPGRTLVLKKNPDWWARDLPLMRGQMNLDEIRTDYFGDGDVVFEAFKAGLTSTFREGNAAKWDSQYDFPRVRSGEVVKSLIPHQRPSGITGFVMNTRKPQFADWRVREAMILAFNYEFISQTLNAAGDPRIASYFGNSILGMSPGPAEGDVLALLAPFRDQLPPGTIEGYSLPVGDGSERNRANIRRAAQLLEDAGWIVRDGALVDAAGQPFPLDILLLQGASETARMIDLFTPALNRLGITPRVTLVDSAQYVLRTDGYDFDMAWYTRALSLSPGNEQMLYWGHAGVTQPGTRNWMGMNSPAAEAMIQALLSATTREQSIAAAQALDRVLTAGRYVIPVWFSPQARIAHVRQLHYPPNLPIYGDYIGFQPDIWWWTE